MLTEQIAREVARQLAPQTAEAQSSATPRRRPSARDIPSDSSAGVIAPDDMGRAAGSLDAHTLLEPHVAPAYEPPGPFPGNKRPELGHPAPRGARWEPGGLEDSGPQAATPSWDPPLTEERSEPEPQAAISDSVWQAPAWVRPEPQTPTWTPPTHEPQAATPTWSAPTWDPPASAEPPAWSPEPTRARTPRIPELGLEPEVEAGKPEFATPGGYRKDDEFDDQFVDGGFGGEFEDEFDDRPATRVAAVEAAAKPKSSQKPSKSAEPPAADARPRAKPPKDVDDDDFDDDDDDDFDDDDDDDDFDVDEDDSRGSMAGEILTSSTAAPVRPRKLPWIPIALASSVLVMISAYAFRDAIFGTGETDATEEAETAGEAAEQQVEPEPQPEPEPKPEPEPEPEPPPPAIPAEELEAKLAEAENLLNRQKHADAGEIIDEILEKMPKEPRALALRCFSQLEKRKVDDALATANECVTIDASQALCWITIAAVEQEKSNLPRALEGYRKYLELEPSGRFAKTAKNQVERLSAKVEG